MEYIYIDEKGPQDTFRITQPFNKENKIAYGTDNMHVFVANIIKIPEDLMIELENEYQIIEKKYLETRNFKEGTELKGSMILKRNFKFGVSSLKNNELSFYNRLFTLLNENKIDNLLFSISKMSLVIDSRLNDWILDFAPKFGMSAVLLKYTLAKYATIEASKVVVEALLDKEHTSIGVLLQNIKKDMKSIISKNRDNPRMHLQLRVYKYIIDLINSTKYMEKTEPNINATFNWEKVIFKMELWLLEDKHIDQENMNLILDEGIPKTPFERLNFNSILEDAQSEEQFGVRISDVLVAISGSYISILSSDNKYDFDDPSKPKRLNSNFFNLDESRFNLLKQMGNFFLKENKTYGFGVDTYFDDGVLFESFLKYIKEYDSFELYNSIESEKHTEQHWLGLGHLMQKRYQLAKESENVAINLYGNLRLAIEKGVWHPL